MVSKKSGLLYEKRLIERHISVSFYFLFEHLNYKSGQYERVYELSTVLLDTYVL